VKRFKEKHDLGAKKTPTRGPGQSRELLTAANLLGAPSQANRLASGGHQGIVWGRVRATLLAEGGPTFMCLSTHPLCVDHKRMVGVSDLVQKHLKGAFDLNLFSPSERPEPSND
jgi:hypothetical protein